MNERFSLEGRVVAVTGGAGLLGREHALAVAEAGGIPVILDVDLVGAEECAAAVGSGSWAMFADVTDEETLREVMATILLRHGRLDALINNACRNPKVNSYGSGHATRLEEMPISEWQRDLDVGLTGVLMASRVFGSEIPPGGSIVNIASDLALISPDQRLYRIRGVPEGEQPVKPVGYSVVKTGVVGMTRWLATYWADRGIRVNCLSPGGVQDGQPAEFVAQLVERIPLGRMARPDEYRGAIVFLCSDASSYMTGQNLVIDGGRTIW